MAKLLIVEDEPMQLEMYEMAFRANLGGVEILTAKSGDEALQKIMLHRPDLVLLDIILPDINGLDVLRRLKKDPKISGTPVIIMTNYDAAGTAEEAVRAGAEQYIVKSEKTPSDLVYLIKQRLKLK